MEYIPTLPKRNISIRSLVHKLSAFINGLVFIRVASQLLLWQLTDKRAHWTKLESWHRAC